MDYLIKDAKSFSEKVLHDVSQSGLSSSEIARIEYRLGVPGQIGRALKSLDRLKARSGELTKREYQYKADLLARDIHRILGSVDNEEDYRILNDYFEEALPTPSTPGRGSSFEHAPNLVATRRRELEVPKPHFRLEEGLKKPRPSASKKNDCTIST